MYIKIRVLRPVFGVDGPYFLRRRRKLPDITAENLAENDTDVRDRGRPRAARSYEAGEKRRYTHAMALKMSQRRSAARGPPASLLSGTMAVSGFVFVFFLLFTPTRNLKMFWARHNDYAHWLKAFVPIFPHGGFI